MIVVKKIKFIKFINGTLENEAALYNVDNNEIVIKGDDYHDKIYETIDGIIQGIEYIGIEVAVEEKIIYPGNEMFTVLEFYGEEEEE